MTTPNDIDAALEDEPTELDESLYEDELDHEGHWFEIWGED